MPKVQIDIVSDVVCPWCIIGYKRLELALRQLGETFDASIQWHPFELNPAMGPSGQNLQQHLAEKYGASKAMSDENRKTITQLGQEVGFTFHFVDDMRIYNTRQAHQLLMWARSQDKQFDLEMALFEAYFTDNRDISLPDTLLTIAEEVGIDTQVAKQVLSDPGWAETVASTEQQWLEAGISAVPAIIINRKHLIAGAQSVEALKRAIEDIALQIH